ncbi:hypothetical protein ACFQWB_11680 [Paenibacillus thermoaerophilus]|uniref:Uncharacterized protein n=1 Tax=Paenibacillus thermoaerophilus TaxID=1215385 RepID=A0ABW2V367_9BACL|nr:hypothetical protein [Paenibacillus thermoaerophilus]TMV11073.1 hypothetical protein FE781_12950 [Paenibacillus thermoaerophilus]
MPQLQTQDEIRMVKEYLVLAVMLDLLEHDAAKMQLPGLKMSHLYIRQLRSIQQGIPERMRELRREFKRSGIRIVGMERSKTHIRADYLCRGYRHEMMLQGDLVKSEIEVRLERELAIAPKAGEGRP